MPWAEAFGVVGLGRMAQALLLPLLEEGLLDPSLVQAVVASQASADRLSSEHGLHVNTNPEAAWTSPMVLLAVKPQQLDQVAGQAAACSVPPATDQPSVLVSVLAGIRLERLQRLFPGRFCVRAVPNTPCLVRRGLTALAWGEGLQARQQTKIRQLFSFVGEVWELPEAQLDAFLALTSSGPAYVALIAESLADGAVAAGLPRDLALHLANRTLAGSAELLSERKLHPAQLKDMVSSPAGTTIAGLRELEQRGVRAALIEAVLAAANRSRALG